MDRSDPTPLAFRGDSFASPRPNRRTLVKGVAWSAPVLAVATTAPALAASSPTGQCFPEGTLFDAQALGRLVSGAIGGINLDTVAEVEGVHARAFDPQAPGADGTDRDEQANPLSVEALSALTLNLGGLSGALSTILDLTAGAQVGAVNQYGLAIAEAEATGSGEIGGSGTVSDNGTLELATGNDGPPQLGTLNLREVLEEATELPGVADLVGSVADLTLEIGALGGLVTADSLCEVPDIEQVDRRYVLASLGLDVETAVVGELLSALESALPELTISTGAVWDLLEGVPLLGGLLSALGESALEVTATVDVTQLTAESIPDEPNAALQLDLGEGTIAIDLASLLGGAYTGNTSDWLNELGPNTRLFVDAPLPGDAVTGLVDSWVDDLVERLKDLVSVTVRAGSVSGLLATGLLIEGSLRDFLDGTATAEFVLSGVGIPLGSLLNPLLGGIGDLVESTLRTLLNDNAVLETAFDGVNALLATLFDVLSGVLAITLNAQNNASGTMPAYYQSINDPAEFDVAALHLEVLGVADLLNLSLGRGIYGPNVARTASSDSAGFRLPFAD